VTVTSLAIQQDYIILYFGCYCLCHKLRSVNLFLCKHMMIMVMMVT